MSEKKSCVCFIGHSSISFSELHQWRHCYRFSSTCWTCWDASEGESKEGEPSQLSDWKLPKPAQPSGRHSSEKQCSCEKQLPDKNRYLAAVDPGPSFVYTHIYIHTQLKIKHSFNQFSFVKNQKKFIIYFGCMSNLFQYTLFLRKYF